MDDIIKILRKYGICKRPYRGKTDPGEYVTVCQGCGKKITNRDQDLDKVAYTVTKRGDAMFFHRDCAVKAWNGKIKWLKKEDI